MNERPHIATLFATAVILASFVTLAIIYLATSRPRMINPPAAEDVVRQDVYSPGVPASPSVSMDAAVRKGDVAAIEQQMKRCVRDRTCDLDKSLRLAAASKDPAIAKMLIAAGARVNAGDKDKETALHLAASGGGAGMVEVLLQAGADVNARDDEGLTPLHSAAAWGHLSLTGVLLAAGADANAADQHRQTPLHLVAARRVPPLSVYAGVARKLLDAGARINVRTSDGSTPLRLARLAALRLSLDGNVKATGDANEVVTLLRERGGRE